MFKKLIIFFLLLISTSSAYNTYYFDQSKGNDNNSGLTTTDAWKSLKKLEAVKFNPGDIILLKRGETWNEEIEFKSSGRKGEPIIIADYGTGNLPVIDGMMSKQNCFSIIKKSFITVRNIYFTGAIGQGNLKIKGSNNIIIESCEFYVTGRGGVFLERNTECTVFECRFTTPSDNYNVQTDGIYSQRNSNLVFDGNFILITNQHPVPHCDGIQSYLDTSIIIRNNYVEQRNNKVNNAQGIYATNSFGTHIYYNNVVYCPNTRSSVIGFRNLENGDGSLQLYFNTLKGGGSNILFVSEAPNVSAMNNIFITTSKSYAVRFMEPLLNPENINYNLYFHEGNGDVVFLGEKRGKKNVEQLRSAGSEVKGIVADPLLDSNYKPLPNSPAIDAGIDLGIPYNKDKDGVKRPYGKAVDLGAYESIK